MDDWTYPYPEHVSSSTLPAFLDQDRRAIEAARLRATEVDAGRSDADLEQSETVQSVVDSQSEADRPTSFATRASVALTF